MKIFLAAIALILAATGGYCLGYKKGGNDFAYLDHMMMGMLANADINRCEKSEEPRECYRQDQEMRIGHSFVFYTQYQGYITAVANLYELASSKSPKELCAYVRNLGPSVMDECRQEVSAFRVRAGENINQPVQPTADAAAD